MRSYAREGNGVRVGACDRGSGAYRRIINDLWQRRVNDKNDTPKNDVGMSDNEGVCGRVFPLF